MAEIVSFLKLLEERLDRKLFVNDRGDQILMPVMTMTRNEFTLTQVLGMLEQLRGLMLGKELAVLSELVDEMKASSKFLVDLKDNWELRNLMRRYSPQFVEEMKSGKFTL